MTRVSRSGVDRDEHLSPEDIGVLAEGRSRGRIPPHVMEHLARCRSCMAAYADTVRYRGAWLAFPSAFQADEAPEVPLDAARERVRRVRQVSSWLVGAAAVAIVAGAVFVLRPAPRVTPTAIESAALVALIERASAEGLVLPGGEARAADVGPNYRAGATVDPEAARVLEAMRQRYENAPPGDRDAVTLATALIAAGQVDLASDYVAEGRRANARDARLMILAGVIAYRRGDLGLAERELRTALTGEPRNVVASLDLGIVIAEARGLTDATRLLESVIARDPRSPLAERARRVLAASGAR